MAAETGFPLDRITTIRNGVNLDRFRLRDRAAARQALGLARREARVVGTVGRLVPVKDQATLVDAVGRARRGPGCAATLVIAGDGPERAALEARAARARRRRSGSSAIGLTWSRCSAPLDVFVLSSVSEGLSNTILEAMASGPPVVATRVGGADEMVEDGVTGVLVPPLGPAALAGGVCALCCRRGRGARAWARPAGAASKRSSRLAGHDEPLRSVVSRRGQRRRACPCGKPRRSRYTVGAGLTCAASPDASTICPGAPVSARMIQGDVRPHRASRARRRRRLDRRARRARPPPAGDHRSQRGRPPADDHRRRRSDDHVQRRDLQLPRAAARARGARPRASARRPTPRSCSRPTASGASTASRSFRGMFAFALWDAPTRSAVHRARPRRQEAAPLLDRPRRAGVRLRAQGVPGRSRRSRPEPNLEALSAYLNYQYVPSPLSAFKGVQQAAAGPLPARARTAACTVERYWKLSYATKRQICRRRRPARSSCDRLREAVAAAPDQRRAARRVPQRRHRLERRRGADGRPRRTRR